jgi:uncharacterized MAPEG superfamily protein
MLFWILAGLGVFLANIYLPAALFFPSVGVARHVASRDDLPQPGRYVGRARRSLVNYQENLPIFLTLGLLAMIVDGVDMQQAVLGAQIFVLARIAYIACYMASIPWTRSAAFTVGFAGQILMFLALI